MKALLFGATGMIGQGVLRECLLDPGVTRIVAVGRRPWYNAIYLGLRPLYPVLSRLAPTMITTTEQLGRAMLAVARNGYATQVLEMADINRLSTRTR